MLIEYCSGYLWKTSPLSGTRREFSAREVCLENYCNRTRSLLANVTLKRILSSLEMSYARQQRKQNQY